MNQNKIESCGLGSDVSQRTEEEAEQLASSVGLVAFFPLADEAFLDIDSPDCSCLGVPDTNTHILSTLHCSGGDAALFLKSHLVTVSKSGVNKHVYLRFNSALAPMERIAVQSMLGSDLKKEALTLLRIRIGGSGSVALFETPEEAESVRAWRAAR